MAIDHFEGEDVIITFEPEGFDLVTNMEGKITSYKKSGGGAATEDRYAFGGKTFNFQKPRDKFTVEMEYITRNTDFAHMHFGHATAATAGTAVIRSDATPKRWRIISWFVPKDFQKGNAAKTVTVPLKSGSEIYRIVHADCKAVTNDIDFASDDVLKGTISFEVSATDSSGYPNVLEQYHNSTASSLEVLNATAYRGTLTWNTTAVTWTGSYRT